MPTSVEQANMVNVLNECSEESSTSQRRRADLFRRSDGTASVVSHRGTNTKGYPPNTVPALRRVVEEGADWVEIDVQLSADGDLVLYHNVMHEGDEIRRLSTRELQRRGMPTLAEAAAAVPEQIGLLVDVKHSLRDAPGEDGLDLFSTVSGWADEVARSRAVAAVSFCPTLLKPDEPVVSVGVSAHLTVPLYQTLASCALFDAAVAMVHADDVLHFGEEFTDVDACVAAIDRFDVAVVAWEVEPDDVSALLERGVTGLCGDDVLGLVAAARDRRPDQQSA
jgi:glycerophosphoryl diester phosphodiesterase